jgi:hypothetical protein
MATMIHADAVGERAAAGIEAYELWVEAVEFDQSSN